MYSGQRAEKNVTTEKSFGNLFSNNSYYFSTHAKKNTHPIKMIISSSKLKASEKKKEKKKKKVNEAFLLLTIHTYSSFADYYTLYMRPF